MNRQLLSTVFLVLLVGSGCAVSREELCGAELPRLRADLEREQTWLAEAAGLNQGRTLASVGETHSEQDEELFDRMEDQRERAQDWALGKLSMTQKALDLSQRADLHEVKPVLTRLNNELVSYYGYAADLNWKRMERRLVEIGRIVDEAQAPLCGGGGTVATAGVSVH